MSRCLRARARKAARRSAEVNTVRTASVSTARGAGLSQGPRGPAGEGDTLIRFREARGSRNRRTVAVFDAIVAPRSSSSLANSAAVLRYPNRRGQDRPGSCLRLLAVSRKRRHRDRTAPVCARKRNHLAARSRARRFLATAGTFTADAQRVSRRLVLLCRRLSTACATVTRCA